jgi:hypothetical protein
LRDHLRRYVAALVVVSFCCVMPLSASPISGRAGDDKTTSETIEKAFESPRVGAEKEAASPTIKKKHSALPWILGGVGFATIVAALLMCKPDTYDIRGQWRIEYTYTSGPLSGSSYPVGVILSGTKESGIVDDSCTSCAYSPGEYRVNGANASFFFFRATLEKFIFNGHFENKSLMKGYLSILYPSGSGSWIARKISN